MLGSYMWGRGIMLYLNLWGSSDMPVRERRYALLHHVREEWYARPQIEGRGLQVTAEMAGRY